MKIHSPLLSIGPRFFFTSFSRATCRAALSVFSAAVLLAGGTVTARGQVPHDRLVSGAHGKSLLPIPSVSIPALGTPITQNFDSLANTGATNTWTDNTTLPGWYSQFAASSANPTTYAADTGSSSAGEIYSFGIAGAHPVTDRALGSIASNGTGAIYNGLRLSNDTGSTIGSFSISYTGEQWRNAGNSSAQTLSFQYQVANAGTITDANTPTTGWISFSALDFVSPITGTTATALDGNAAANRTAKSANVTVTVGAGQEIWLRWADANDSGADHALAIDDLSVTANSGSGSVLSHTIQGSGSTSP
jgi:hypothetical protein